MNENVEIINDGDYVIEKYSDDQGNLIKEVKKLNENVYEETVYINSDFENQKITIAYYPNSTQPSSYIVETTVDDYYEKTTFSYDTDGRTLSEQIDNNSSKTVRNYDDNGCLSYETVTDFERSTESRTFFIFEYDEKYDYYYKTKEINKTYSLNEDGCIDYDNYVSKDTTYNLANYDVYTCESTYVDGKKTKEKITKEDRKANVITEETSNIVKKGDFKLKKDENGNYIEDENGFHILEDYEDENNVEVTVTYGYKERDTRKTLTYSYNEKDGYKDGEHYYDKKYSDMTINNPDGSKEILYQNDEGYIEKRVIYYPDNSQKIITYDLDDKGFLRDSHVQAINPDGTVNNDYVEDKHIEYYYRDEYRTLMKNLIKIFEEERVKEFDKLFDNINDTVCSFFDKYTGNSILTVKEKEDKYLNDIKKLEENINYSLLSYETCDNDLIDTCKDIIDNLFEDDETNLSKVFKKRVNKVVEDKDNDGILEYKDNFDYKSFYKDMIPRRTYTDDKGNTWFFNLNNNLISANGENLKINYGGEEFSVSFDNGVLALKDSNGKPLSIFGDYNLESSQYGGNQMDFRANKYDLLEDGNINKIFDKYDPVSTPEERMAYLESVCDSGCGKVAATNVTFNSYEGKENEFYDTFGYPMYNVKMAEDGTVGGVDYNYEPLTLDFSFAYKNEGHDIIDPSVMNNGAPLGISRENGTLGFDEDVGRMFEYLEDIYGASIDNNDTTCLYFGDSGYNIYDMDGNLYYGNGGGHAMVKLGETDDGRWIVSSWGRKFICEPNIPDIYEK